MDPKWEDCRASDSSCKYSDKLFVSLSCYEWLYSVCQSLRVILRRASFGRQWASLLKANSVSSLKKLSTWWSVWVLHATRHSLLKSLLMSVRFWWNSGFTGLLCVQGNLQVFYQDLPFSIQDGYESFLSPSTVSLQQYQVPVLPQSPEGAQHCRTFSLTFTPPQRFLRIWRGSVMWCTDLIPGKRILMDIFFIVITVFHGVDTHPLLSFCLSLVILLRSWERRYVSFTVQISHDVMCLCPGSLVPSSYTRQLNLPLARDRAGRQLKRKRSASPPATSRWPQPEPPLYLLFACPNPDFIFVADEI